MNSGSTVIGFADKFPSSPLCRWYMLNHPEKLDKGDRRKRHNVVTDQIWIFPDDAMVIGTRISVCMFGGGGPNPYTPSQRMGVW